MGNRVDPNKVMAAYQRNGENVRLTARELGWHHHIHKSSPNENAVIERSFRTDEEEFFWRM